MEKSLTGKPCKWYNRYWWNKRDDLNELGVKVAENEEYTEYAVHYMIRNKKPPKSSLPPEVIEEGDELIRQKEQELKELREVNYLRSCELLQRT